jgi:hypothetical protein
VTEETIMAFLHILLLQVFPIVKNKRRVKTGKRKNDKERENFGSGNTGVNQRSVGHVPETEDV